MAREIFLLGYDAASSSESQAQASETWAKKLEELLGMTAIEPAVFRPAFEPYRSLATSIAEAVNSQSIYDLNSLDTWELPFNGPIQAAACLIGGTAYVLHQNGAERRRHEQRIIIAQQPLVEEFRRHSPSAMYATTLNEQSGQQMFSYVIREVSPDPTIKHR